jgi:predicted SprT family Zn-dependent metalloprotease
VIVECPCGQKIQVPDPPPAGAAYVCNRCYRTLPIAAGAEPVPAPGKNRRKRLQGLGAGALAIFLVVFCAVLYYNTPPAEVGPATQSAARAAGSGPASQSPSEIPANSPEDEIVAPDVHSEPQSPAKAREDEIVAQDAGLLGDPELENDYQYINDRYFDNQLPTIPVLWEARLEEVGPLIAQGYVMQGLASAHPGLILLNPRNRGNSVELQRVLCHEMVHVYLYTQHDLTVHHGAAFQREWRRLLRAGAFQGIVATQNERSSLQARLESESRRLNAESAEIEETNSELDQAGSDIDQQKSSLQQEHQDLNERIAQANQQGEGWPSREEMDDYQARARALNLRIADFRARVAALNAQVAGYNAGRKRFNQEVARFRMMMDNPDALEGNSSLQDKSELTPRR